MGGPNTKRKNPYSAIKSWVADPSPNKERLTPGRWYDYHRIAKLPDAWGTRLDALGASYEMLRWIAGAHDPAHAAERDRRYRAVVGILEGGGGRQAFVVVRDAAPYLGRFAAREARRADRERSRAARG